jgi:hypothetical protein
MFSHSHFECWLLSTIVLRCRLHRTHDRANIGEYLHYALMNPRARAHTRAGSQRRLHLGPGNRFNSSGRARPD